MHRIASAFLICGGNNAIAIVPTHRLMTEVEERPVRVSLTPAIPMREKLLACVVVFIGLAIRLVYIHRFRFDSDEPQHLHVVWGWIQGMVAYRDFFDNHTPLFHILYAPVLKFFGERADILVPMRLALLPLYFLSLWCVHRMSTVLSDKRTGLWAAIFAGIYPYYFFPRSSFARTTCGRRSGCLRCWLCWADG